MKIERWLPFLLLHLVGGAWISTPQPTRAAEPAPPASAPTAAHAPTPAPATAAAHAPAKDLVLPAVALRRLAEGNQRFVDGQPRHPHEARSWRQGLEKGQKPFAVVLGCSDSRVPPELIFDQGFGDLFIIRVAGNVLDEDGIASIEYAVEHLGSRLIVVLGHSSCGAVTAAWDHLQDPGEEPAEVVALMTRIEPALVGIAKDLDREKQLAQAVKQNVDSMVRRLSRVPDVRKVLKHGDLAIAGAVYDIHTGKVQFLP